MKSGLLEREPPADAGKRPPVRRRTQGKRPVEPVAESPGQYSVDSRPYATIFIDGKSYGDTPLFKISLLPGKHRIRAVREDGQVQRFAITIDPGKLTSSEISVLEFWLKNGRASRGWRLESSSKESELSARKKPLTSTASEHHMSSQ